MGVTAGLVAWLPVVHSVSRDPLVLEMARPHLAVQVAAVVVLALMNSVGEELLWRGALWSELGPPGRGVDHVRTVVYLSQALSFGLAHRNGEPGGWIGVGLTAVFALACVWLRLRSRLRAAVVAHFLADVGIFLAAAPYVVYTGWVVG